MTPSYSRVTNMLFWSLLLGSLLAILVFEFGPERRLDILSQASLAVRAQDDRANGGQSVTTLIPGGDKPAIDCKLRAGHSSPFCELILTLSAPEWGLDLSHFNGVRVKLRVEGSEPQSWRLYLRNYDPAYSIAGTRSPTSSTRCSFVPMITAASRTSPSRCSPPAPGGCSSTGSRWRSRGRICTMSMPSSLPPTTGCCPGTTG
ncbi:hypothetical protein ACSZMP_19210 [Aeromonas rivipollensis]